jgi:oxygen-independent coproporphyrinogen-3 oxidase
MNKDLPPLSLYIHIPWCERKCPYCDFNSHENKQHFNEDEYIDCLIKDFQKDLNLIQKRTLQSIFIGGGTPSLFKVNSIGRLLSTIKNDCDFSKDIEITLEANPASSQENYFSKLSDTLVNRVSLGVQSFQSQKLTKLGRLHSNKDAQDALESLTNNFANFNIDLMFGLPEQSIEDSIFDLQSALNFSPPHLSWYQLTIEPNTVFFRNKPILPDDDFIFDMQQAGIDTLNQNNLQQYELSAFSKKTQQSQHNLNYWQFGDYLAIGAGAHGKITQFNDGEIKVKRFQKSRSPKDYLANIHANEPTKFKNIARSELALEFFMNSLRLTERCSLDLFYQRTGLTQLDIEPFCVKALNLKLISMDNGFIKKTELGNRHVDSLLNIF